MNWLEKIESKLEEWLAILEKRTAERKKLNK